MRIAFYEKADWEEEYIRQHLAGHELAFYSTRLAPDNAPDAATEIISTFTDSPVTAAVLEKLPNVRLVATRTTGFDHIDLKACQARGITVCNVPAYGENTVAEFAFTLILALARKLYPAVKRVREEFRFSVDGLAGFDLQGKTIGVVGTGRIGAHAVRIAKGFGMEVLAYDPYPSQKLADEYHIVYVPLEELLAKSDVITLHVPYMPATHHLISKDNIMKCKPGALLVNTARGAVVETEALLAALRSGILGGAGLDVLEEEGFVHEEAALLASGHPGEQQLKTALVDHELMHMDNVLVTPHNAFNTREAIVRILDTTIENIQNFAQNKPINAVKAA